MSRSVWLASADRYHPQPFSGVGQLHKQGQPWELPLCLDLSKLISLKPTMSNAIDGWQVWPPTQFNFACFVTIDGVLQPIRATSGIFMQFHKGGYFKDERSLGGRGQMRSVLVTMASQYKVTMTSFCVQRREGVKKGRKMAVILKVCPLKASGISHS